jgi:iron complex outermembrane receptor protein
MRVAYTHYDFQGVLDNFYQKKNVLSFTGKMAASDFATFELNSNLFNIRTNNRYPNIGSMVAWGINRDYPFSAIKDMYKNDDGSKFDSEGLGWPGQFAPSYLMDILWEQYENNDTDEKFHYIGSLRATLDFTDWLYLVVQAGVDYTDTDFTTKNPLIRTTPQNAGGRYAFRRNNVLVQNYRGFLNFDKKYGDFGVMAFIGGEYRANEYNNINVSSYGAFNYPDFWSIDNSSDWPDWGSRGRVRGHSYGSRVLYAVMASATLSWRDEVYVELQGRNDWSSTLDPDNNSYFYPGVAANWNFTNTYDISWLDFGKLRMAWADVGRPAPGYYYAYQSYSTGSINNSEAYTVNGPGSLFSGDIKPERKREFELGLDGRMLNNRLEAVMSYYHNNVYDQIMGVNLSAVTGASEIKINAGNVANWGLEFFIKGAALSTPSYRWDIGFTAAVQKSQVKELYPGITRQTLGGIGNSVIVTADEGKPYGELLMYDYMTDGQGNRVVNQNGNDYVLDKEEFVRQGNIADRVFGGVMSDFFWKGFNFHVGIDYKFGGSLFSYSNYYLLGMGISKETLKYRDEEHGGLAYYIDDASGLTVAWDHDQAAPPEARDGLVYHDGLIMQGVVQTGGTAEDPVYSPNEKIISAAEYYSTAYIRDMSTDFQPDNLYKNEYIKLRELAVAYTVPSKFTEKVKIQKLVVSFLARDLFYFYKSIPNIDSESALGSGSFTEYSFFPSVRSYGIGINVSF